MITVAYYALIPSDKIQLRAATDAEAVGWFTNPARVGLLPRSHRDRPDIGEIERQGWLRVSRRTPHILPTRGSRIHPGNGYFRCASAP